MHNIYTYIYKSVQFDKKTKEVGFLIKEEGKEDFGFWGRV